MLCNVRGCSVRGERACPHCAGWRACSDHERVYHHCTVLNGESEEHQLPLASVDEVTRRTAAFAAIGRAAHSVSSSASVQPGPSRRGGFNLHVPVSWSNEQWYARVKLQSFGPRTLHERMMANEWATLGVLHDVMPEFVPRALMPKKQSGDELLFFVQRVEGRSVHDYTTPFTAAQFSCLINDLATVYIRLASRKFAGIGSLTSTGAIGPLTGPAGTTVRPIFFSAPRGPFETARERYLAQIDHVLGLIERGAWSQQDVVGSYLFHLELRALVKGCAEMRDRGPTYLAHGDDRGDHILIRPDGGIAGVIDWELAYTAPLPEAMCPRFLSSASSNAPSPLEEALCAALISRGYSEIADAIPRGRKYLRLNLLLGSGVRELDAQRVWLARHAFLGEAAGPQPKSLREWLRGARETYAAHEGLQRVMATVDAPTARRARLYLVDLERREVLARRVSAASSYSATSTLAAEDEHDKVDDWVFVVTPPAEAALEKPKPRSLFRKLSTKALAGWRGATKVAS